MQGSVNKHHGDRLLLRSLLMSERCRLPSGCLMPQFPKGSMFFFPCELLPGSCRSQLDSLPPPRTHARSHNVVRVSSLALQPQTVSGGCDALPPLVTPEAPACIQPAK